MSTPHKVHEQRRKLKNIRNEMKSLVHRRKRLPKIKSVGRREREKEKINKRMDELENKMDSILGR